MKTCVICQQAKPFDDFYRHPKMADGYLNRCKECHKSLIRKARADNVEHYREYDRRRAKIPERAAAAAAITRAWMAADKRRLKCHNAVARAVRSGKLTRQPCLVCGSTKSVAHHESYDRPLDVAWYCQPHHKARHRQMAIDGIDP